MTMTLPLLLNNIGPKSSSKSSTSGQKVMLKNRGLVIFWLPLCLIYLPKRRGSENLILNVSALCGSLPPPRQELFLLYFQRNFFDPRLSRSR